MGVAEHLFWCYFHLKYITLAIELLQVTDAQIDEVLTLLLTSGMVDTGLSWWRPR